MPAESPFCSAIVKKKLLMSSRLGRPKEILETPRIDRPPSSSRILRTVSSVVSAEAALEEMVSESASKIMSFLGMP